MPFRRILLATVALALPLITSLEARAQAPSYYLSVVTPFGVYQAKQPITDPATMAAILAGPHAGDVTKVNTPGGVTVTPVPVPAPCIQAQIAGAPKCLLLGSSLSTDGTTLTASGGGSAGSSSSGGASATTPAVAVAPTQAIATGTTPAALSNALSLSAPGAYAYTPMKAAFSPGGGTMELIVQTDAATLAAAPATGNSTLFGAIKGSAFMGLTENSDKSLGFVWQTKETYGFSYVTSAAAPLPSGTTGKVWLRVRGTFGASQAVTLAYSLDGTNYVPLATPTVANNTGAGTVIAPPIDEQSIMIGEDADGGEQVQGNVYSASLSINSTPVLSPDFTAAAPGAASVTDAQGNVWTLRGAGAAVVAAGSSGTIQPLYTPGIPVSGLAAYTQAANHPAGPNPTNNAVQPTGVTLATPASNILDAEFTPGGNVTSKAQLDAIAAYAYIYGNGTLNRNPGAFRSTHTSYPDGDPRSLHTFGPNGLTLRAHCTNGGAFGTYGTDCDDNAIESGIARFQVPIPTAGGFFVEVKAKQGPGRFQWGPIWLNPGLEQTSGGQTTVTLPTHWTDPDGSTHSWPPEIDGVDETAFYYSTPGYTVENGTPDCAYNGCPNNSGSGQYAAPANFAPTGYATPADTFQSTAAPLTFDGNGGQYDAPSNRDTFNSSADLSAGFHTYGLDARTSGTLVFLFDGVPYRVTHYLAPAGGVPWHLIIGDQIADKSWPTVGQGSSGGSVTDQGGVQNGWDLSIAYVRVWNSPGTETLPTGGPNVVATPAGTASAEPAGSNVQMATR